MSLCNKAACVNTISAVINTTAGEHQGMDTRVKYACNFRDPNNIYSLRKNIIFSNFLLYIIKIVFLNFIYIFFICRNCQERNNSV